MTAPGARAPATVPEPGAGPPGLPGGADLAELLSTREHDLAAASVDFGRLVHRRPLAVLHPRGPADVAAAVRFGRDRGLPVVPRGAGHTVDGQALVSGGIVVQMAGLAEVGRPGPDRISVAAGATWSAVLDATLPAGLAPPVLPDYLALSVGGTLSAGGIGGASHQHGCVADNVYDLDVVTPAGQLVDCSPARYPGRFDAVRGTQGEHGTIVRATLALARAPGGARRYLLGYRGLGTFLADQRRLVADRRFAHVGGQAQLGPDGGWRYLLEAVATFTAPRQPDDRALLAGLRHEPGAAQVLTTSYRDFLDRLEPLVAQQRASGSWQHHPHPRCNVLLPGRHAEPIVAEVLGGLTARRLGPGGSILLYPVPTARLAAPHMPKARDDTTVVFGVQRTAPPDDPALLAEMRQANADLRQWAETAGGASYSYPTAYHEARHADSAGPTGPGNLEERIVRPGG